MKKIIVVSALLSLIASPASANSLCGNNSRCQQSDRNLNQLWQSLTQTERDVIRPLQRRWLTSRDNICRRNASCIADRTEERIKVLEQLFGDKAKNNDKCKPQNNI